MFCRGRLLFTAGAGAAAGATVAAGLGHRINDGTSTVQPAEAVRPTPVHLKPSSSPHRKPSFYFPRMRDEAHPSYAFQPSTLGTALPLFSITASSCEYYALRLPLLKAGFRRVPPGRHDVASNLIWGRSMPFREIIRANEAGNATSPAGGDSGNRVSSPALDFPAVASPEHLAYLDRLTMVNSFQRFNHFPLSHTNLGCKRGMAANMRLAQQQAEVAATTPGELEAVRARYRFAPRTWFYPQEKESLVAAMKMAPANTHFIWKPARGSCGRGIFMTSGHQRNTSSWEQVMRHIDAKAACKETGRLFRNYVVQEYIEDPFLVEGRKMDLRLYVAVTSYNPLTVYWHEEGLVRLAAEFYTDTHPTSATASTPHIDVVASEKPRDITSAAFFEATEPASRTGSEGGGKHLYNRFQHLTNYSVGRKYAAMQEAKVSNVAVRDATPSDNAFGVTDGPAAGPELKWPLQRLWDYIDNRDCAARPGSAGCCGFRRASDRVKEEIAQLVTRTLMAVRPVIDCGVQRVRMPGSYFELYGFDVMLDSKLNPFLIEVNTLPSLESSSSFDYATKTNVVSDLLNVAMLEPFEREAQPGSALWNAGSCRSDVRTLLGSTEKGPVNSLATFGNNSGNKATSALPAVSREEVQLQLTDELAYARGFQRIFPAKPMSGVWNSAVLPSRRPLDSLGSSRAYLDDVHAYESNKLFTERDLWAHES